MSTNEAAYVHILLLLEEFQDLELIRDHLYLAHHHVVFHWEKTNELDFSKLKAGFYPVIIANFNSVIFFQVNSFRLKSNFDFPLCIWLIDHDQTSEVVKTHSDRYIIRNEITTGQLSAVVEELIRKSVK